MEPVCPLDHRYGRKEMKEAMSHASRLARCLEVEAALARAQASLGMVPREAADEITRKATLEFVDLKKVEEVEQRTRHDIMAVVQVLSEACGGDAGRYVHLGATSYDMVDTALALQLREGLDVLDGHMEGLIKELATKAKEHRDLVMVGRTHGQWAVPITLGFKFAVWLAELDRHRKRLNECRERVLVGKMSGAVGTGAALGDKAFAVESKVMEELGLAAEEAATQIVQRDRLLEVLSHLCNLSVTLEKMATEIRTLQRPEIGELAEPFDAKDQVGSSTMSHKRNPIVCENITGLSRTLRGFLVPAFESAVQWNERDLSNSSAERFIVPHMMLLADEAVFRMTEVIGGLRVDKVSMARNLKAAGDVIMAEAVIMALCGKGMGRQEAHELTRKAAMAHYKGVDYRRALLSDPKFSVLISPDELDKVLDPARYTGTAGERVDRVLKKVLSP